MKQNFIILTPVYNDWENLNKLLIKINDLFFKRIKQKFDLIIIDDCSSEKSNFIKSKFKNITNSIIIKNSKNLGSQRSIAVGLKYIKQNFNQNYQIIIIDSDGQDNPEGIIKMILKQTNSNNSVVVKRGQRKESLWFKIFYEIYCILTFVLTYKRIRFGNYSLIKFNDLSKILKDNNLWNAFPPTLSLNLTNISSITMDRETRYSGNSKINFLGLIYHALRVFSVLRLRILFFSSIYLVIFYYFLVENYLIFFILISFILVCLNVSNFILSIFNKKNFRENYKKIKILN